MERWMAAVLLFSLFMAGVLALFASPLPDGLERVAMDQGFAGNASGKEQFPIILESLAGIAGTLIVFCVAVAAGKALEKR